MDRLADDYQKTLCHLLDKHAPLQTKTIMIRPSVPWFSEDIAQAKGVRRQYERMWRRTRLQPDLDIFKEKRKAVCHLLDSSKSNYHHQKSTECGQDGRSLYKVMDGLLGRSQKSSLPAAKNTADLFCEYFSTKIEKIRKDLDNLIATAPPRLESQPPDVKHTLATFREASEEKYIRSS